MIDSMIDVNRLEDDSMPIEKKTVKYRELIECAVASVEACLQGRRVDVIISNLTGETNCDRNITIRILTNLLGNAVKYTRVNNTIVISVEEREHDVYFSVTNPGQGIAPKYHEMIFEKFGQIKSDENDDKIKFSAGLGLAFCKLAVEAQEGKIGVISDSGKDTTFWFTLPKM